MNPPASPPPARVLVVDDDSASRMLATRTLRAAGFDVAEAKDGEEGVARFAEVRPDLILMDVIMPRLDGFAACRRIRAAAGGETVPVLMLTALDDHASIEKAYEAGATDFVTKPVKWATLTHRLRYMLRASAVAEALRGSEARLANAQRIARLGQWEWDVATDRVSCSPVVFGILGTTPETFGGTFESFASHAHRADRARLTRAVRAAVKRPRPLHLEYRVVRPAGNLHVVHLEAEVVTDDTGRVLRVVGTIQDITERHEAEERIRYLAMHDSLTDLPNRVLFKERLGQTLAGAHQADRRAAVLFVGLDRFNRINASLGYDMGDALLKEAALRLTGSLTEGLPPETEVEISRFGGDEFTVVLKNVRGPEDVATVARRILDGLSEPYALAGREVFTTTSIGIALAPEDGKRVNTLLRNADAALRHAKGRGKNTFQFYTAAMNADAERRMDLENKLRKALDNDELLLHYQPQVDIRSGRIVGVEALLRWEQAELGMVSPVDFIPLAEETGMIVPIGEWVLSTACAQGKRWRDDGLPAVQMSVNLSARQFWQDDLAPTVARILVETGLEPRHLELELTESTFMQDAEATIATLRNLKDMGVAVAVDDFGTGYSSLGYLRRFPIDALKIDRSFIHDVTTSPDSAAITRTIIAMGRGLKLRVVAEGVETAEQFAFLAAEGCHHAQGYLLSRPVPADALAELLTADGGRIPVGAAR